MSVNISKKAIEPIRTNFAYTERRVGSRPATRYQEATYDVQAEYGFHYRPVYDPSKELYDSSRTAIVMGDWYTFMDPRQFYYTPYVTTRANQQEVMEKNLSMIEKQELLSTVPEALKQLVRDVVVPLRHVEYAANMNNQHIADQGYGASITGVAAYCGFDHIAMSQYVSKLALALDDNEDNGLIAAREAWMDSPVWQPLRALIEEVFVVDDWFETLVAQDIVLDGLLHPLVFGHFMKEVTAKGGIPIAMMTAFMNDWYPEEVRWTNHLVKVTAKESDANNALLTEWTKKWVAKTEEALKPVAELAFGDAGAEHLDSVKKELIGRLSKQGLKV